MKNAIYLDNDFIRENQDSVNVLLRWLDTLINSTDGVLTGQEIWRTVLHKLNIDRKQEIIDSFGLSSLEDKIYDIKSIVLYKDAKTYDTYLLFNVRNDNKENFDADVEVEAEAFAKIYAKLNELQDKTGVKIEATITTDGINVESSKDNIVYRIIVPKRELDEAVDPIMVIDYALNTVIKKVTE